MDKNTIALRKLNSFIFAATHLESNTEKSPVIAMTLSAELMNLGYILDKPTMELLIIMPSDGLQEVCKSILNNLLELKGTKIRLAPPMYPGFPAQVMTMSDAELYSNALLHYWTAGEWRPPVASSERSFAFEDVKFQTISSISEMEFRSIFTKLVSSADSISEDDKAIVEWFFEQYDVTRIKPMLPPIIPFKENMCLVAGLMLRHDMTHCVPLMVKTATDVLRVVTYLNDGDISLATNTKFKSLPRPQRRMFTKILEDVATQEDIGRHRNKWIKLAHNLHVGEYSEKVRTLVAAVRNNEHIESFNGQVQSAIDERRVSDAIELLKTRPGEYARRLDSLLRKFVQRRTSIVEGFEEVVDDVPTRILVQLIGHFKNRTKDRDYRIVFPKGAVQKAIMLDEPIKKLPAKWVAAILVTIEYSLLQRFSCQNEMGKVYIDPAMNGCPIPSQMRSAAPGLKSVARGTRMPIGKGSTVRLFVYWVGQDIDLSATFHNENFEMIEQVSYTNLRSANYKAVHSGDIVDAPNGASEYVDIDIKSALEYGARYVAMNVLIYAGHESFAAMDECFVGWMARSAPGANHIYEPKTVQQKVNMTQESRRAVPVLFDLKTREAIWVDMAGLQSRSNYWGNNVHSNSASIEKTTETIVSMDHKMSLYSLMEMHATARGELVAKEEDADMVVGFDGTLTPYDIMEINAEYLV